MTLTGRRRSGSIRPRSTGTAISALQHPYVTRICSGSSIRKLWTRTTPSPSRFFVCRGDITTSGGSGNLPTARRLRQATTRKCPTSPTPLSTSKCFLWNLILSMIQQDALCGLETSRKPSYLRSLGHHDSEISTVPGLAVQLGQQLQLQRDLPGQNLPVPRVSFAVHERLY